MGTSCKSFFESWFAEDYTWDLTDAVKLLLGIDPAKDKKKIELLGNDKALRIYAWAIKKIKEGDLTAVDEKVSDAGAKEYRVLRDDFVQWAHKNYKNEAQSLYTAWKSYKKGKKKWKPSEKIEKRNAKWQGRLDELYIEFHKKFPHKGNFHSHRCLDVAKEEYPGLTADELDSKAETIRKSTRRRDRHWILGKLGIE